MLTSVFNSIGLFFHSTWGFLAYAAVAFLLVFFFAKNQKVFVISLVLALALGVGLKAFFDQPRPCEIAGNGQIPCPSSEGFPSTHAVATTALAMGAIGTSLFLPLFFLSVIISLSRVWLGVHSLDQIAGGVALAVMVYLAVFEIWQKFYGGDAKFDLDEMLDENLLNKKVA
ncbi:MAG: phosphatase PAP2 family protein [Candidatus Norongarragalinales archaeon]